MYRERRKGLFYSVTLHLLLLLLMIFGLPSLLKNEPPVEPTAITVELLPISELSNIKNSDAPKDDKPKPEEIEKEAVKPSPLVKTAEATPPPPKPTPAPIPPKPDPKPEPKPEPKKEPKKESKKPKEDDLAAILKAVRETAQKEKTKDKKESKKEKTSSSPKAISNRYDPTQAMSISEKDAIMGQLAKCWNPPAGAKNAHELVVVINAEFNIDGSYIKAEIADESMSRYNSDSFFRSAADSALRAVRQCSPLKIDPTKYDTWKAMELHFDPREMLQ